MKIKNINLKMLFILSFAVLLLSRIAVLTENYSISLNPVLIEMLYIFIVAVIVIWKNRGIIRIKKTRDNIVLVLLLLHVVLFGILFSNPLMKNLINNQFKSQIIFIIIVSISVIAIRSFDAFYEFIECSYYTLSLFLMVKFITHLSDVKISNIMNIMSVDKRIRANFGFGHYNALGAACVLIIMLTLYLRKIQKARKVDYIFAVISVIMLLCSASRNAITGIIIFLIAYIIKRMKYSRINPRVVVAIKCLFILLIISTIPFMYELNYSEILKISQRSLIFYVAFPLYMKSGRILIGLGYASNADYGSNLTPYMTSWLDNSYMYYLITTGVIGFAIIMIALVVIWRGLEKNKNFESTEIICCMYYVYMYMGLFEVTIFESGSLLNYVYLPLFIFAAAKKKKILEQIKCKE